jgi:thymidine kinase
MHTTLPHLHVVCGPMFAGKTTRLLLLANQAQRAGVSVLVIKPARDNRYDPQALATHTGDRLPAHAVHDACAILPLLPGPSSSPPTLVLIDEAHFFGAALMPVVHAALAQGLRLVVAGVERDHHGAPFEPFPALLVEADEVTKLTAPCARCGNPAIHSQRMIESDGHIVVGGPEAYQARCRRCFGLP